VEVDISEDRQEKMHRPLELFSSAVAQHHTTTHSPIFVYYHPRCSGPPSGIDMMVNEVAHEARTGPPRAQDHATIGSK
jgi:hypothetical protein